MATTKTFQSELPALLQMFMGSQTDTTQSTSANTGPLQQVYNQASQPMTQELYNNLISSIFQQSAQQVPTLTAALANATGSRSSTNSPLALALNQQNNDAGAAAAQAILGQQNKQMEIAGSAARGIADSTRTSNTSAKTGTGSNPLVPLLGGFALNKLGAKGGMFDKLGDKIGSSVSGGFDSLFGDTTLMNGPDLSSVGPSFASGFGGVGTDAAVNTFSNSGAGDFFSNMGNGSFLDAIGLGSGMMDSPAMDAPLAFLEDLDFGGVGDAVSGGVDQLLELFNFADGGNTNPRMRQELRPSYAPAINNTVFGYADGGSMAMPAGYGGYGNPLAPRVVQPTYGFGPADVVSIPGSGRRYADGGMIGQSDMMFADGGVPQHSGIMKVDQAEWAATNGIDPNNTQAILAEVLRRGGAQQQPQQQRSGIDPMALIQVILSQFGKANRQPTYNGPIGPNNSQQFADGGTIRNKNYMGSGNARFGMNSINGRDDMYDTSTGTNSGAGNNGTTSVQLIDYLEREQQRQSGGTEQAPNGFGSVPPEMQGAINAQMGIAGLMGLLGAAIPGFGLAATVSDKMFGTPTAGKSFMNAMNLAQQGREIQGELNSRNQAVADAGGITVDTIGTLGITNVDTPGAQQTYTEAPVGTPGGGSYAGTPEGQSVNANFGGASPSESSAAEGGGGVGAADGGLLTGRGTGTSDSLLARSYHPGSPDIKLSKDEFIIPADVVAMPGMKEHFQSLINAYHTPVRR